MSAYSNDPRVVKVSDREYQIPDGDRHWTVREVDGRWNAYDQDNVLSRIISGMGRADSVIAAIIGDPR